MNLFYNMNLIISIIISMILVIMIISGLFLHILDCYKKVPRNLIKDWIVL